jgi:hypothetical protein
MSDNVNHSMPIKQAYHSHIRESKEHPKNEIMYEFLDDYSYANSSYALIHIRKSKKGETYLYVSMEKGPSDIDTLNRIVKWRISGNSTETGHRGGGNKRFIYGHDSKKVSLSCKINSEEFLRLELYPDDIYKLSENKQISEGDFQKSVDRDLIKWSSCYDLEEDGAWFAKYLEEINSFKKINYVIRFTLTNIPIEYEDPTWWEEFISTIQMKNYQIPIYYKNELLGEESFSKCDNIDMIGWEHQVPDSLKEIHLYVDKLGNPYLKYNSKFRDCNNKEVEENEEWKFHSIIHTYQIDNDYFDKSLNFINDINKPITKYKNEDFYGVYVRMNGKQTSFKPISKILVDSRNLSLRGNSYFRLVIDPVCDNKTLDSFITTDTIKAKTRFKDTAKACLMAKAVVNICKPPKENKPKPYFKKLGLCYLVYFGRDLYKYGYIDNYNKLKKLLEDDETKGLPTLREIYSDDNIEEDELDYKPLYTSHPISNPVNLWSIIEEKLLDDRSGNINMLDTDDVKTHKYFNCSNMEYLINTILKDIFSEQFNC